MLVLQGLVLVQGSALVLQGLLPVQVLALVPVQAPALVPALVPVLAQVLRLVQQALLQALGQEQVVLGQVLSQPAVLMQPMLLALVPALVQVLRQARVSEQAFARAQPKTPVPAPVLARVRLVPQGRRRWPAAPAALEAPRLPAEDLKFRLPALEGPPSPVGTCLVVFQRHSWARYHRAPQLVLERWRPSCH